MRMVLLSLIVAGLLPIALAIRANRATSLGHALIWSLIAWLSWGVTFLVGDLDRTTMEPARYCALCLTGCVGVAVLGARRPHVFAWNFVVLGLFAVMVLPLLETLFLGTHPNDGLRVFFLSATLAVGILNYLPTRMALPSLVVLIVSAGEIALLYAPGSLPGIGEQRIVDLLLTLIPWLAWGCWSSRADRSEFDRLWLTFRDRWGLVWSQRVREQFNHACLNAGVPAQLTWRGLRAESADIAQQQKSLDVLRATLQRFVEPTANTVC
jgi:hypothetical protein